MAFRLVCTAVIWAMALAQMVPVLVLGRRPLWRGERVVSPRLRAVGGLLIPVGCTLGIVASAWGSAAWPIGPTVVLAGIGLTEWARRTVTTPDPESGADAR